MTVEQAPAAAPAENSTLHPSRPTGDIDDPYQCAFCGRQTDPADRRCPHCNRSLLSITRATLQPGAALATALFLISVLAALSLLEAAPPLFAWQVAQGADPTPYQLLLKTPGAAYLLGQFLDWPSAVARALLLIAAGRTAILVILAVGLRGRFAPLYYLAVGALVLDALWNMFRMAAGYTGVAGAVLNLALGLGSVVTLFSADKDFAVVRRRLLVQVDGGLRGGAAYHKRGHAYRQAGMWALAVAHWRLAVGAQPREVQYYKDLAVGYAQIERFERSLIALEEAARQAPEDAEIEEMAGLVRRQMGNVTRDA